MFKSILVPLDGSTFGEHALPLALTLAKSAKAKLTLLHVHAPLKAVYLEGAAFLDESIEDDIKKQQQTYLQMVKDRLQDIAECEIETRLAEGEIASTIASQASAHGNDLVIMTTHGRGTMGRFWLGSVADELIRQVPMPLLLVRPHEDKVDLSKGAEIKHILISLDGSDLAEHIIEPAISMGEMLGADYTLVRIIKPVMPLDAPVEAATATQAVQAILQKVDAIQQQLQDEAKQYLEKIAEKLRKRGLSVTTRVDVEDQPGLAIVKESQRPDVDMVALETHGRSGLSRLFLGSTADKVVRGVDVPVLLHRPERS